MRKLTCCPNLFDVPSMQITRLRPSPVEQPRGHGSPSVLNYIDGQNLFRTTNGYGTFSLVDRRQPSELCDSVMLRR